MRSAIRQIGTQKLDSDMNDRPFGGLNVLCCGDFWQLDPPDGGFLAGIPTEFIRAGRKYEAKPTIAHGQALFWSEAKDGGFQGMTELVQCERCDDEWLTEVQEELRHGKLSENNHKFLHGEPTVCAAPKIADMWIRVRKGAAFSRASQGRRLCLISFFQ